MKQPNFKEIFDSFSEKEELTHYVRRKDSNAGHDMIFISSMLHDSTFEKDNVKFKEGTYKIKILRLQWEKYQQKQKLIESKSLLTIKGIKKEVKFKKANEILHLNIDARDFNKAYLIFTFTNYKRKVPIDLSLFEIEFKDKKLIV